MAITKDGSKLFACGNSNGGAFGVPNMNKVVKTPMVNYCVCVCVCVCVQ